MPVTALETALYNKLSGNSALTTELGGTLIYNKLAPQNPGNKYVVFQWQGGGDENDTPTRSRSLLYGVYGIATGQATAATIDGLIDTALHDQTLTISGWANYWMARETDINIVEPNSGQVPMYRVGGIYRISMNET